MTTPLVELTIRCPLSLADLVAAVLFEVGTGGVEERACEPDAQCEGSGPRDRVDLVVYASQTEQLDRFESAVVAALAGGSQDASATVTFLRRRVTTDWENEWIRHLRPMPIGDALVVQPLGDESPLPRGRRPLVLRPAWAFGDGSHPTTQLAGDAVERYCRDRPGCRVLDVGTGSGVLALVALASGAATAKMLDIAPEALDAARENAALNHFAERCEISAEPLGDVQGAFDLVVCNINESSLLALARDLARLTAADGRLAITGLIADDTHEVEAALVRHGLSITRRQGLKEWVLLELERS